MRVALFPSSTTQDGKRLIWAKGLRAVADGYVSILLPAYLLDLGYGSVAIGALTTATLLGSAALTLASGLLVTRFGHRLPLLAASALMIATGVAFANFEAFWPLLIIAFVGTLNPSASDVSLFLPLEQSLLSRSVSAKDRTALFARYSLVGAGLGAFGTLLAALPDLVVAPLGISRLRAIQAMFLLYSLIALAAGLFYCRIADPPEIDISPSRSLGPSRRIVYKLTALFCVDAFGGGFFVQSMLALWLFKSFDVDVATTAQIFFWSNLLSAASYLAAAPIAARIGLINTMVFTHLPSSLCLIAIPFVPNFRLAVGLLLVRSLLSQMDVPTRTSYVMAMVTPAERPAAASLTSVPRSLASAVSPILAGYLITASPFGWPLMAGGMLKIAYDLTLLMMFRHVRPPEERLDRPFR